MADIITLTSGPFRGTAAVDAPLYTARDVLAYDILDISAGCVSFETPGGAPSITVSVITGFQRDSTDAWVPVGFSTTLTSVGQFGKITLKGGFGRYIRWRVTSWGTQAAATWWVRGMARTYDEMNQEASNG